MVLVAVLLIGKHYCQDKAQQTKYSVNTNEVREIFPLNANVLYLYSPLQHPSGEQSAFTTDNKHHTLCNI